MPQSINDYKPVLSLLSTARLESVSAIFNVHTDLEKYDLTLLKKQNSSMVCSANRVKVMDSISEPA